MHSFVSSAPRPAGRPPGRREGVCHQFYANVGFRGHSCTNGACVACLCAGVTCMYVKGEARGCKREGSVPDLTCCVEELSARLTPIPPRPIPLHPMARPRRLVLLTGAPLLGFVLTRCCCSYGIPFPAFSIAFLISHRVKQPCLIPRVQLYSPITGHLSSFLISPSELPPSL